MCSSGDPLWPFEEEIWPFEDPAWPPEDQILPLEDMRTSRFVLGQRTFY